MSKMKQSTTWCAKSLFRAHNKTSVPRPMLLSENYQKLSSQHWRYGWNHISIIWSSDLNDIHHHRNRLKIFAQKRWLLVFDDYRIWQMLRGVDHQIETSGQVHITFPCKRLCASLKVLQKSPTRRLARTSPWYEYIIALPYLLGIEKLRGKHVVFKTCLLKDKYKVWEDTTKLRANNVLWAQRQWGIYIQHFSGTFIVFGLILAASWIMMCKKNTFLGSVHIMCLLETSIDCPVKVKWYKHPNFIVLSVIKNGLEPLSEC